MDEPLLTRLWRAVKPPPPVPGQRKPFTRSQRLLLGSTVGVVLVSGSALGLYVYSSRAPERAEAAFQKGMTLLGPGHYQLAIDEFTKAIAISPRYAQAYLQRGLALQALNHTDAAMADFENALDADPNLAPAHTGLGLIYRLRGDRQRAVAEFSQSIKTNPTMDAYYQRGQILQAMGEFTKANEDYGHAIELMRDAPFIYRARAWARRC